MQRESFIFYASFYSAIVTLPENEQLLMFKSIVERALYGKEPTLSGCSKGMYDLIIPQIKANERRFLNGCKGGAPKGNKNAKKQPKNNQKQPNDNVNDNVNLNVTDKDIITPTSKQPKHKYGEHNNVLLTDDEYLKLKERYPTDYEEKINRLSEGIALKGYIYKSHYLAVIKWADNDNGRMTDNGKNKQINKTHFDYDQFAE